MNWVAWRQYRLELLLELALLAALAAFLIPTGLEKFALFRESGLAACLTAGGGCRDLAREFSETNRSLRGTVGLFIFVPAIAGILLAAPIALEFEQRTHRIAWTQSVTRGRWLATKLAMAVLLAAAFAAAFTGLMTWWYVPQTRSQDSFASGFHFAGAMPLVYAIFALAVALLSGVLSRRAVVAVMVTMVVFTAAMVWVGNSLRPHYLPPVERIETISASSLSKEYWSPYTPGLGWFISGDIVDSGGRTVSEWELRGMCGSAGKNVIPCLESHGLMHRVRFHPADRFWTFQAIEAAIYLGMAAPLLGLSFWVVTKRMR